MNGTVWPAMAGWDPPRPERGKPGHMTELGGKHPMSELGEPGHGEDG
jgi:hypothetical protein